MYQPAHGRFRVDDPASLLEELCAVVPATLVTHGPDGFRTTILPMLFDRHDGPHGTLRGHMARGNPHWRELEASGAGAGAIAIFHGTDAYISPAWYEEKRATGKVVPTWNYVTVQAQGTVTLLHDAEWLVPHVARLVDRHEAVREDPWALSDAPDEYIAGQARAIVGLELRITGLEAKTKLSQNRSDADIHGAIEALADGTANERTMADVMRRDHEGHEEPTR
ncbi:MAG TPA: FMN-binding negative transcriptional regulator [Candidatus Limnocylindrales bacterium]|nr:FMN-binding negative transcriptional regulator [Candidatus Limnocylindrales bacterium]